MTEATVDMDVRTPSPSTSIIDLRGEVTGRSDAALSDAYERASGSATRATAAPSTAGPRAHR